MVGVWCQCNMYVVRTSYIYAYEDDIVECQQAYEMSSCVNDKWLAPKCLAAVVRSHSVLTPSNSLVSVSHTSRRIDSTSLEYGSECQTWMSPIITLHIRTNCTYVLSILSHGRRRQRHFRQRKENTLILPMPFYGHEKCGATAAFKFWGNGFIQWPCH